MPEVAFVELDQMVSWALRRTHRVHSLDAPHPCSRATSVNKLGKEKPTYIKPLSSWNSHSSGEVASVISFFLSHKQEKSEQSRGLLPSLHLIWLSLSVPSPVVRPHDSHRAFLWTETTVEMIFTLDSYIKGCSQKAHFSLFQRQEPNLPLFTRASIFLCFCKGVLCPHAARWKVRGSFLPILCVFPNPVFDWHLWTPVPASFLFSLRIPTISPLCSYQRLPSPSLKCSFHIAVGFTIQESVLTMSLNHPLPTFAGLPP